MSKGLSDYQTLHAQSLCNTSHQGLSVCDAQLNDTTMPENENLRTASLYINNQLLSRGLLQDGQTIHFADPALVGDASSAATMGRIMAVVNDLILRRDVCSSPPPWCRTHESARTTC